MIILRWSESSWPDVTDGPDIYDEGVIGWLGSGGLFGSAPSYVKRQTRKDFFILFLNLLMR